MPRMGAGVAWSGHFAAVMLDGGVGTFCLESQFLSQPGWPLAGHLGTWGSSLPPAGSELGKAAGGLWTPQRWAAVGTLLAS